MFCGSGYSHEGGFIWFNASQWSDESTNSSKRSQLSLYGNGCALSQHGKVVS